MINNIDIEKHYVNAHINYQTYKEENFMSKIFTLSSGAILLCCAAITGCSVSASDTQSEKKICDGAAGTHDGKYFTFYSVSMSDDTCMTIFDSESKHFSYKWNGSRDGADVVGGMGWEVGNKTRDIGYNVGDFSNLYENHDDGKFGSIYISVYGWDCTEAGSNMVEYYIVENWHGDEFRPYDNSKQAPAIKLQTTEEINGSVYDIYETTQIQQPNACGPGNADFKQYWSIRRTKAPIGVNNIISFSKHVDAWNKSDLTLSNNMGYQVMGPEGIGYSSGQLNMTVWEN